MSNQLFSALHEKLNAPLYIDVTCYDCKRCVAMSNTDELDGRRYCHRCFNSKPTEEADHTQEIRRKTHDN